MYLSARLAANPDTADLATGVEALLTEVDEAHAALRLARRAEVRARARRDHHDGTGDERVRRFKRRTDVFEDSRITARVFPLGLGHVVAPRGRPQIERLHKLAQNIEQLASSPAMAAHADADELKQVFDQGMATIGEVITTLTPMVEEWEARTLDAARASDVFKFRRADGIARLGVVLGHLRAKLGGDQRAAYAYTQSARTGNASADESVEVVEEVEG